MKVDIKIPTSLREIPLRSYQQYLKVVKESNDEEFIAHKFINIFLGLSLNEAYKVSAKDVNRLIKHLTKILSEQPKFQNRFKMGDIEFGFIPDLENISWGEYIDLENNLQSWENYHIAMAVMYRPIINTYKDTYEIQEYDAREEYIEAMKLAPLDVVISSSVFFWSLEVDLLKNTLDYLEKGMRPKIEESLARKVNLPKNGDGITLYINWLKEMLDGLTKSLLCLSIEHLPSLITKPKKNS
jgi:hypothetical protein